MRGLALTDAAAAAIRTGGRIYYLAYMSRQPADGRFHRVRVTGSAPGAQVSMPESVATPGAARIRRAAHLAAGASRTQGPELHSRTRAVAVPPTRISLITGFPSGPGMAEIAVAAALASRSTSFPRNSTTGFPRL